MQVRLCPGESTSAGMLNGRELEELAWPQLGNFVDGTLLEEVSGIEGPGGALVVEGEGARCLDKKLEERAELFGSESRIRLRARGMRGQAGACQALLQFH